jgi:RHS repeat-associated protein
VAITNSLAEIVAKYTYDAWGKVLSVTNASDTVQTSASFIGNINPIRYRGYYYDVETGFYYLQSRYYDPETGRFVNADGLVQTGTGLMDKNMYAYCLDDPVNNIDPTGQSCHAMDNGGYGPLCMFANGRCITHGTVDCCGSPMSLSAILDISATMSGTMNDVTAAGLKSMIKNAERPANIGKGLYAKQVALEIAKIEKISSVTGSLCDKLSYACVIVEACEGINDNYLAGKSLGKIYWDAGVDTVILGLNTYVSIGVGTAVVGALSGTTICPVVGTAIGAGVGVLVGVGLTYFGDPTRNYMKSWIN